MSSSGTQGQWAIDDVERLFIREQGVYWIPDASLRAGLQPGDHAKLVFRGMDRVAGDECVEKMWVRVTRPIGSVYVGVLDSKPRFDFGLAINDRVQFSAEHVADIQRKQDRLPLSDQEDLIFCERHGPSVPSHVCEHIARGQSAGFNTAANAEEKRPDAWCDRCDDLLDPEVGWEALGDRHPEIVAVCAGCYDGLQARNADRWPRSGG